MKLSRIFLIVFFSFTLVLPNFLWIREASPHESSTIPFEGMIVKYNLTGSRNALPLPPAKFWAIWTEPFNDSLITSRVEVIPDISLLGQKENGTVTENVTSRLMEAHVSGDFLSALYEDYFSPDVPNYSPFWIFPNEFSIGGQILVWNFTFSVESSQFIELDEYGELEVWKLTHFQTNSTSADHDLSLLYEKQTGLLLAARLWVKWIKEEVEYDVQFQLVETNVKLPSSSSVGINLLYLPLIGLFGIVGFIMIFQSFRSRKLHGGI
ncbi:MAG: hypothetical protein ACFFCQ_01990 [Promethearchaeota archaeon]